MSVMRGQDHDYGYTRRSTSDQDGAGQLHRLLEAGIPPERIHTDIWISGMTASRPWFDAVLSLLTAGDVLVVRSCRGWVAASRTSCKWLKILVRGIGLRILDLALDTTTPVGRMTVTVLAAVARLERISFREDEGRLVSLRLRGEAGGAEEGHEKDEATIRAMREAASSQR